MLSMVLEQVRKTLVTNPKNSKQHLQVRLLLVGMVMQYATENIIPVTCRIGRKITKYFLPISYGYDDEF